MCKYVMNKYKYRCMLNKWKSNRLAVTNQVGHFCKIIVANVRNLKMFGQVPYINLLATKL